MKKTALILTLASFILFGCKNVEKKETFSEENIETVNTSPAEGNEIEVIGDNSENSLDWAGVYEGTTPCADCGGIKTVLELKNDKTYTISRTYLGKPEGENEFKEKGTFSWGDTGSEIILKTEDVPMLMKVGENQLWMLDGDGNTIEGDLAEMYILKKKAE